MNKYYPSRTTTFKPASIYLTKFKKKREYPTTLSVIIFSQFRRSCSWLLLITRHLLIDHQQMWILSAGLEH